MKLFIREHIFLILVQFVQMGMLTIIFLLAGIKAYYVIAYVIFLNFVLLLIYLLYMYVTRRNFYKRLSKPIPHLDVSLEKLDFAPISEHLQNLLKTQYNAYETEKHELEKKSEQYFMFLDRWIHQMKTPVSVLQLMAKELDEPASSSFQEEIDHLQSGLNMVLYMARVRTMQHDFHIKQVHVKSLVQQIIQAHKRVFIRNKVYPSIDIADNMYVESDEKWLYFILTQFIENGIKYSANKNKTLFIRLQQNKEGTILQIEDEGVGIPESDIKRIFNPFYTGENGRIFRESTGIGLYLVKEICEYLGHDIRVQSTVGKGTTFSIYFT